MVSFPSPDLNWNTLTPASPYSASLPFPPYMVSSPKPPYIKSLFLLPVILSLPFWAYILMPAFLPLAEIFSSLLLVFNVPFVLSSAVIFLKFATELYNCLNKQ